MMDDQTHLLLQVEMVTHLTKAGLGSLELFSMGLKSTGTYLSRALSYKGAEFSIAKVDIDPQFQCVAVGPSLHDSLRHAPGLWASTCAPPS
jgi:P-loop containing NTP hydrolase pore-1